MNARVIPFQIERDRIQRDAMVRFVNSRCEWINQHVLEIQLRLSAMLDGPTQRTKEDLQYAARQLRSVADALDIAARGERL